MRKESDLKVRRAVGSGRGQSKSQGQTGFAAPLTLRKAADGLTIERYFTRVDSDPFDEIEWETRDAIIGNE